MTKTSRLPIIIAALTVCCTAIRLAEAQRRTGTVPRQKVVVQGESGIDSISRYKIDSQLLQAISQQKKQKNTGTPVTEPVEIGADSKGNLPVDISANITDSLLHTIIALGGKIIYPSKEYHTVRAIINLSVVQSIALRPDVTFIRPAVQAHNNQMPSRPALNQPDL